MFAFAGYPPTPYGFSKLYEKSIETRNYKLYFEMIIIYTWHFTVMLIKTIFHLLIIICSKTP